MKIALIILALLLACLLPTSCLSIEPDEVLVVANRNARGSMGVAEYYMKKRGIPESNFLRLWVTDNETCSRTEYEKKIAGPVRRFLTRTADKGHIRCLVLIYGMPLRVEAPFPAGNTVPDQTMVEMKRRRDRQSASVDSELTLVKLASHALSGWIPNPYYLGNRNRKGLFDRNQVLMVSRLDGPSEATVKRIIDDSFTAEKRGLQGMAYLDARWKYPGDEKKEGYAFYDASIHRTAGLIVKSGKMTAAVDESEDLFKPGDCQNAALYCGWYSLTNYVDAFDWVPGAVGYHIASGECATLRRPGFRGWCKMMIEDGVAATVGPVEEPYVQAFPVPEIFFGFLVDGYLSLAECYMISTPFLSWKMVLIGDPLYRPFKNSRSVHLPLQPASDFRQGREEE